MGLRGWYLRTFKPDAHDLAFKEVHENPTTDHELLCLFETGDFLYEPYVPVKTRAEYEKENWDEGREPK